MSYFRCRGLSVLVITPELWIYFMSYFQAVPEVILCGSLLRLILNRKFCCITLELKVIYFNWRYFLCHTFTEGQVCTFYVLPFLCGVCVLQLKAESVNVYNLRFEYNAEGVNIYNCISRFGFQCGTCVRSCITWNCGFIWCRTFSARFCISCNSEIVDMYFKFHWGAGVILDLLAHSMIYFVSFSLRV